MHDVTALAVSVTIILVGILFGILFNQRGLDKLEVKIDKGLDKLEAKFDKLEAKVDRMQADLTMFSHELGLTMQSWTGWRARARDSGTTA